MNDPSSTAELDPLQHPRLEIGRDVSTWPTLKIARAAHHLAELQSRITLWTAGRPMHTEGVFSDDRLTWQFILSVTTLPPVEEWSLILGDFVHSLRSSLDACIWEFATRDGRTPSRPRQVQFPIIDSEGKWADARRSQLQTVPDEIAERVHILQPFRRPEDERPRDALVLLQELSNRDKHRSSISVGLNVHSYTADMTLDFGSREASERNVPPQVEYFTPEISDGALLIEHKSVDPIMAVTGGYSVGLKFGIETALGVQELMPTLNGLLKYAQDVLAVLYGGAAKDDGQGQLDPS